MIYLAAGLAMLALVWLAARAFVAADPAKLAVGLRWTGIGVGAAVVVVLAVRGLLMPALLLGSSILATVLRFKPIWDRLRSVIGPSPGQSSGVETEWLRMSLDHDTGEMSGTVRRGPFQGRRLEELSQDELVALWRECRAEDEPSAALVESFLERVHPGWREPADATSGGRPSAGRGGAMSEAEAWAVLDLQPGAGADEIKAAHHRLMMKVHPDHGGSNWLASRINEAKALLLKKTAG